jgi:hypothetical protein
MIPPDILLTSAKPAVDGFCLMLNTYRAGRRQFLSDALAI